MKLRHEINMIDRAYAPAGAGAELVYFDTSKYSGSVTSYFEVINSAAVSNLLVDSSSNTHTDLTSVAGSLSREQVDTALTTDSYKFSAASGTISVARLIVLQDTSTDPLYDTEHQIEIGNCELEFFDTTGAGLTYPKYWYYDSSNWDGTLSCYAEVVWSVVSNKYAVTIKLQEDNGSWSWSDKVTIVNAGTSETVTRTRVAFTPTTGRHYRIWRSTAGTKASYGANIYLAKIIVDQTAAIDSYTYASSAVTTIDGSPSMVGQSFTGDGSVIYGCHFCLSKSGLPTGNAYAKLYTETHATAFGTDSLPTGSPLATSAAFDISTLGTDATPNDEQRIYFSFSVPYTSGSGTKYVVVLDCDSASIDSSNYVLLGVAQSSAHSGNRCEYNSGSWSIPSVWDCLFGVYSKLTKWESQHLLINTAETGTGLAGFNTKWDTSNEWDGVDMEVYHQIECSASSSDADLYEDADGTPAKITGSDATGTANLVRSGDIEANMPSSSDELDTYVNTA